MISFSIEEITIMSLVCKNKIGREELISELNFFIDYHEQSEDEYIYIVVRNIILKLEKITDQEFQDTIPWNKSLEVIFENIS